MYRIVLRKKGHINSIILKGRSNKIIDQVGYISYSKYKMTNVYCINLEKFLYWYSKGLNLRRSNNKVLKYCFFLLCLKGASDVPLLAKSYFRITREKLLKKLL